MGRRTFTGGLVLACLVLATSCKDAAPVAGEAVEARAVTTAQAVESPPDEAPAVESVGGTATFRVLDIVLCEKVRLKKPRGEGWRFPRSNGRVWAYITMASPAAERAVVVQWLHGGDVHRSVRLHIGHSPRWHTWDFLDIGELPLGRWTVEVLDGTGALMARRAFWVTEPPLSMKETQKETVDE